MDENKFCAMNIMGTGQSVIRDNKRSNVDGNCNADGGSMTVINYVGNRKNILLLKLFVDVILQKYI